MLTTAFERLASDGFVVIPAVFSAGQIDAIRAALADAFAGDANGSTMRSSDGSVYGARNLMQLWPGVTDVCRQPPLPGLLSEVLGSSFGLVRVLYFDKPPEQSWALPWHKDHAIAVKNNRLPSEHFARPTTKIGVPHIEAPKWLLEQMLTLRLHLDDMTDENGPLKVLPGSHRGDARPSPPTPLPKGEGRIETILGTRGDVLAMRPLLSHCSNRSKDGTMQHRRILHFEFSGVKELPDGYEWHDFISA